MKCKRVFITRTCYHDEIVYVGSESQNQVEGIGFYAIVKEFVWKMSVKNLIESTIFWGLMADATNNIDRLRNCCNRNINSGC